MADTTTDTCLPEEVGHATHTNYTKVQGSERLPQYNSVTRHSSFQLIHARISQAHELVVWRFHRNPKRFHKTKYITL